MSPRRPSSTQDVHAISVSLAGRKTTPPRRNAHEASHSPSLLNRGRVPPHLTSFTLRNSPPTVTHTTPQAHFPNNPSLSSPFPHTPVLPPAFSFLPWPRSLFSLRTSTFSLPHDAASSTPAYRSLVPCQASGVCFFVVVKQNAIFELLVRFVQNGVPNGFFETFLMDFE